jgi:hypothetical protein
MRDWREFLEGIREADLEAGASAEEIADAEQRLGTTLPPGYRTFLATTNGFGPVGHVIRRLRPVAEISWLRDEDPELIRIWAEATGDDALAKTLVVSDEADGARVLLNPAAVDEEDEWEAWFFAHWVPGAEQYGSFRELLEKTYSRFVDDEKARRGEPTPRVAPELGVAADDLEGLVDALRHPDANDRLAALDALANLRNAAAIPAVVALLKNPQEDGYVRATAARTLGQLRDESSVSALIDVLRAPYPQGRKWDPEQRSAEQEEAIGLHHAARQALLLLGRLSAPALAAAVRDPDPSLRAEACATLCYAHAWSEEAFGLVSPLVADPDPEVRLTVVTHIDQLSYERGRELLGNALSDADPRVSSAARETLERLESYA